VTLKAGLWVIQGHQKSQTIYKTRRNMFPSTITRAQMTTFDRL